VNRRVLKRVISPGCEIKPKSPEGPHDEWHIDNAEQQHQPRKQEYISAGVSRRIVGQYQWRQNDEFHSERHNGLGKEPSGESMFCPSEQSDPTLKDAV